MRDFDLASWSHLKVENQIPLSLTKKKKKKARDEKKELIHF